MNEWRQRAVSFPITFPPALHSLPSAWIAPSASPLSATSQPSFSIWRHWRSLVLKWHPAPHYFLGKLLRRPRPQKQNKSHTTCCLQTVQLNWEKFMKLLISHFIKQVSFLATQAAAGPWDKPSHRGGQIVVAGRVHSCFLGFPLTTGHSCDCSLHCFSSVTWTVDMIVVRNWIWWVRILFIWTDFESTVRSHSLPISLLGVSFPNAHNGSLFGFSSHTRKGLAWAFKKCLLSEPFVIHAYLQVR